MKHIVVPILFIVWMITFILTMILCSLLTFLWSFKTISRFPKKVQLLLDKYEDWCITQCKWLRS